MTVLGRDGLAFLRIEDRIERLIEDAINRRAWKVREEERQDLADRIANAVVKRIK